LMFSILFHLYKLAKASQTKFARQKEEKENQHHTM